MGGRSRSRDTIGMTARGHTTSYRQTSTGTSNRTRNSRVDKVGSRGEGTGGWG